VGDQYLVIRTAFKGRAADQQLEREDAEAVEIGACVDRTLGRQIRRCTEQSAGFGHSRDVHRPRDAKVGQLCGAGGVDKDVRRLDVAVDHSGSVGVCKALCQLEQHQLDGGPGVRPVLKYELAERQAIDELECDVRNPIASAIAKDLHHVGRVDPSRDLQLVLESEPIGLVLDV